MDTRQNPRIRNMGAVPGQQVFYPMMGNEAALLSIVAAAVRQEHLLQQIPDAAGAFVAAGVFQRRLAVGVASLSIGARPQH
jgi:hypothetical protein